jgi:hypothetical protein
MSKLKSISKRAIVLAIVAALAVGGIALAIVAPPLVQAHNQTIATANTRLLPGVYRNTPNYFYSEYATTDASGNPKTVLVPADHGDTLINSYTIDGDGNVTLILQSGVIFPPYGPPSVTSYFKYFEIDYYDENGEPIELVLMDATDPDNPDPINPPDANGVAIVTIPAEAVSNKITVKFALDSTPIGHRSTALLVLKPELVQVATTAIKNDLPAPAPSAAPEE